MEFIEIAMKMEKQGVEFYRKLAQQSTVRELAGIFEFFMREEQRHFELFEAWGKSAHLPEGNDVEAQKKAKQLFLQLVENIKTQAVPAISRDDAYETARELEAKSVSYYKEIEKTTTDPVRKKQVEFIIAQEEFHLQFVESLMDFQRHPNEWLENAEWNHPDSY